MEKLFQEHVNALAEKGFIGKETARIASEADMAADELQLPEIEAYAKREVNVLGNFKVLKEHGLLGLHVPKRYSGLGGDAFALSLVFERLGQVSMGLVTSYDVQTCLTAAPLEEWGTEEQKRKYLAPLAKGDKMMSFCLTEPLEGSDPGSLQTKFEENRDGFKSQFRTRDDWRVEHKPWLSIATLKSNATFAVKSCNIQCLLLVVLSQQMGTSTVGYALRPSKIPCQSLLYR